MGNVTPVLQGSGGPIGTLHSIGPVNVFLVPFTFAMSASYANPGGDTLVLPAAIKGKNLLLVHIANNFDGTRWYAWDGSLTTPKIKALSAFATEVTNATDLHTTVLQGFLVYQD